MTNITTKLRSGNYGWMSRDLNAEAADEIDRLRAELAGRVIREAPAPVEIRPVQDEDEVRALLLVVVLRHEVLVRQPVRGLRFVDLTLRFG